MEPNENIVIVGGGIAGLSVALALHRLGLKSIVLESSDSLRVTGTAFVTWPNAWKALDALGVAHLLRPQHCRLSRIVTSDTESGIPTAELLYTEHEVRCLKRRLLLETLAKELPEGTIRFSSKVVSIQKSGYLKELNLIDGSILKTKVLIGCDGVNSIVAKWLRFNPPSFTKRSSIRGYVDMKEGHGLKPEFLQFTGHGFRYGVVPCDDTSIYWFFMLSPFYNKDEEIKKHPKKMKQFVLSNLGQVKDNIKSIIEKTAEEDIICSPLTFRPPWELIWGNITKHNVCVAGDAFHPMTPDIGQGACSSLEDAIVLARCLAQAFSMSAPKQEHLEDNIGTCLNIYAKDRKWRCIDLVSVAYVVGFVQQTEGKVWSFLRDKLLAPFLANLMLSKSDFDCGLLRIS
ncbi:unnamed protein product [Amaranthus hypochondriacus]